ncbi:MAG TPA: transporter substrate-binding domain-containing protein [Candidatus Acidoferrum sp.]|nr:transporter substrate-binding domain-containing protein [Candidatus Acidoferrum sp.]
MTARRCIAALLLIASLPMTGPAAADTPALRIAVPAARPAPAGNLGGFEAELAAAICRRVSGSCAVVADDGADPLAPLLQRKADAVIAGLSFRPELQQRIDLTRAYASISHGFAIARPDRLPALPGGGETLSLGLAPKDGAVMIASLRTAFAGKIIAAPPGTPDQAFLAAHFRDVATVPDYATAAAFESDLAAGRIDAVMAPVIELPAYRGATPAGPRFYADDILGFDLAVGLRKADRAPHDMVDRAIDDMIRDGSLTKLSLKWFDQDITPHRCACKPF